MKPWSLQQLVNHRVSMRVLWTMILGWTVVVGRLVVMRHEKFGTFDFDLGIYDQTIWLLSRGQSFITVRGMEAFGHHATFSFYLLSPLSWLGAGPNIWNVLHCFALAFCAFPLYLLARRREATPTQCLVIGGVWLLQPWVSWLAHETFHPEVMAMPFLLSAFLLIDPVVYQDSAGKLSRMDRRALMLAVVAMGWKEDLALAVMMMGVVVALLGRRRIGVWLAGFGAFWFILFAIWLVPTLGGGTSYSGFYGDLGQTGGEVIINSLLDPVALRDRLAENNVLLYALRLLLPFGLLALASPLLLLIMVPQFFANVTTIYEWTYEPKFHYAAVPIVVIAIATVDGIFRMARSDRLPKFRKGSLVLILLFTSMIGARGWGILPFSEQYEKGAWPLAESDTAGWDAAIRRVGPTDGVAAHYLAVPHLTHRSHIFTFPNPWVNSNFGVSQDDLGDPSTVEWIVIWNGGMNEVTQATLDDLIGSGEFGDPEEINGVVSYRRLRDHSG